MPTIILLAFERARDAPPRAYLGVALRRLYAWFEFDTFITGTPDYRSLATFDAETAGVLKRFFELHGYRLVAENVLEPGDPAYRVFNIMLNAESRQGEVELKRAKRELFSYAVSSGVIQDGTVVLTKSLVEAFAQERGVDLKLVEKVAERLDGLMLLTVKGRVEQERLLALGHIVAYRDRDSLCIVPLRKGVVIAEKRWGVEPRDVFEALKQVRKRCADSESLEELSKCSEQVARRLHAMWRRLLKCVKRHPEYVELYASVLVKELKRLGAEVLSYELWRIKSS